MKKWYKIVALSTVFAFSLTGCQTETKSYCLETSDTYEYFEGKCYQSNRSDVVETVFVINLPTNPEADPSEYKYDLIWNKSINTDNFTFTSGLTGKRIIEVFRWSDTILKINFDGRAQDQEATYGYLRVSPSAFKATSKRAKGACLYAYVSIGKASSLVEKPSEIPDETNI